MTADADWRDHVASASPFDRHILGHDATPTPTPCARCAPERHASADREERLRRLADDHEAEAAELRREVARLRRQYEGDVT